MGVQTKSLGNFVVKEYEEAIDIDSLLNAQVDKVKAMIIYNLKVRI